MKMHLTMKGRLTALALLAVIGICLLAALAVGSNQVTRNALASLYEQDMDSLVRLQRMDNTLVELRFRVAGVLLDQMPIPGSLNHLRDSRTSLAQEWAALAPRGGGLFVEGPAKEAFGQLRDKWSLVDATLAKLERAYGAKDKNAIGSILEDDWPVLVKAVAKPLQGLIPITQGIAQAAYDDALARSRTLLCAGVIGAAACLAGLLALAGFTARSMLRPLREVEAAMQRIAEGDLAAPMPAARRDEVGRTIAALTDMRQRLRDLVVEVRRSTESITTASTEIASGSQDLSGRTERTASNLQQTASSMEQLTGTVRQSADAARQANTLADGAATVAGRGGEVVGRVVATMDEINAASRRIADIIAVIDGIAFQTNILALNAAVEAARAGEQGRGFAVVAGEVRTLAQRSADAAREIKALIGSSVERVDAGSRLVADAGSTMQEIVTSVRRVSGIVAEISAATAEQSNGIGEVNGAVTQLDEMTQQNAALVEQTAAAASSLQDQAQRLSQIVATFRVEAQAA